MQQTRGISFIGVLVAAAVITLVFGGLIASFRLMIELVGNSKAEASALALANERIEYLRSLAYSDVGTISGIPSGNIPQNATSTLNDIVFTERTLIEYIDDPADGVGGADVNGILADYKRAKVEISWILRNATSSISLISNIVPRGIETTAGGGTLTVNVFDATVQPIDLAEVRLYNDTTTSTIDITRFTNVSGVAMFAGAPAAANYEITVTKTDHSTDGTYTPTTTNPNPTTLPVAVLESEVSTMNFQIDELSDLNVHTIAPPTTGSFSDTFTDGSQINATSSTEVVGGLVRLIGGPGSYAATGTVQSTSTAPASITAWDLISGTTTVPASTTLMFQVYSVSGSSYTLISDTDLPGNSTGFNTLPIDVSSVSVGTYPEIAVEATLASVDVNVTPEILEWTISHIVSEPAIGSIPLTFTSSKSIGTASGSPVYKYQESLTTDGGGNLALTDLEWDVYDVVLGTAAYDVSEACEPIPYVLNPGVNDTLKLTLVGASTYSLRVRIEDVSGNPIPGATVDLTRSGFSDSGTTSSCGQTFFNTGLVSATDYVLDVSAAGYTSENVTNIEVDGTGSETVVLSTS